MLQGSKSISLKNLATKLNVENIASVTRIIATPIKREICLKRLLHVFGSFAAVFFYVLDDP
jgi:hypothetical protein